MSLDHPFFLRLARRDTGCWEWTGATRGDNNYGMVWWGPDRDYRQAHRIAAFLAGLIPSVKRQSLKDCVLHKCDNSLCCNPEHLEVGDLVKNNCDSIARGRRVMPAGEKAPRAKLTTAQVREIRAIVGLSSYQIAKQYPQVTARAIRRIRAGEGYPDAR